MSNIQSSGHRGMKRTAKFDLSERIDLGIKLGVAKALEAHRKAGEKVVIWRNGRIVEVLPARQRLRKA
jgi:hypothetical protein